MAETFRRGVSGLVKVVDLEDARRRLSTAWNATNVVLNPGGDFGMELGVAAFDIARVAYSRFAGEVVVEGRFDDYLVCAAPAGTVEVSDAADTVAMTGSWGVIIPPSAKRRLRWQGASTLAAIAIKESDFRQAARTLLAGRQQVRLGPLRAFDLSVYPGTVFGELLEYLQTDRKAEAPSDNEQEVRHLFDKLIVYSLLRLVEDDLAEEDRGPSNSLVPKHVKQAEEYIKAHLAEELDNAMLAKIVRVSPRSLHRGFVHFRGVTPARYIQELRLETVRKILANGGDGRSIGEIASSTGFKSYAAFWRSYVRRFGMAPSKSRGVKGRS